MNPDDELNIGMPSPEWWTKAMQDGHFKQFWEEANRPQNPKVLRSVHMDLNVDDHLRALAFTLKLSKAELINYFVQKGIQDLYNESDFATIRNIQKNGLTPLMPLPECVPYKATENKDDN